MTAPTFGEWKAYRESVDATFDLEDGRALRLLRRKAADRRMTVTLVSEVDRWTVRVLDPDRRLVTRCDAFDRLAENADACRARLEML